MWNIIVELHWSAVDYIIYHKQQLKVLSSYFKLNYIVGAYKDLINKLIFVNREIYNDIHDFLYACN